MNQDIPKSGCYSKCLCDIKGSECGKCHNTYCECHSPSLETWETRFDEEFPPGSYWDDYAEPSEIKSFIKELIAKTREEELGRILGEIEDMRGILWHKDIKKYQQRVARENTLNELATRISALDKETK